MNRLFKIALPLVLSIVSLSAEARKKSKPAQEEVAERSSDSAEIKAPQDLDVCFAPDEFCDLKLVKFIESAEKSIDVGIFDINLDQLVHTLLVKSKKGVAVRIVVDQRQSKGTHSLVSTLIKGGADIRYGKQRGIFHNKFVIVDEKMIETGSFNFNNHAALANQENQIFLANPAIVKRYKDRFDSIWTEARLVKASTDDTASAK